MEENLGIIANELAKKTIFPDTLHFFNNVMVASVLKCPKVPQNRIKRGGFIKENIIVEEGLQECMELPGMTKDW